MYSDDTIALAPFERDDLPNVLVWVNDLDLCRSVHRVLPVTQFEHEKWYEALISRSDAVTFAIRHEGQTIGICGLKNIDRRCRHGELWIYIGEASARGKSLGRRAVRLLTRFGFEQLNLHRIHLYVADYNKAARRVYQICGFQEEGQARDHIYIDGAYHDAVYMGILGSEQATPARK